MDCRALNKPDSVVERPAKSSLILERKQNQRRLESIVLFQTVCLY